MWRASRRIRLLLGGSHAATRGKIALVTGGARGIGRAIAVRLAAEGAVVAVVDRDDASIRDTAAAIGGRALGLQADVTDGPGVRAAVATIAATLGPIDVLVNNAGWTRSSLSSTTPRTSGRR